MKVFRLFNSIAEKRELGEDFIEDLFVNKLGGEVTFNDSIIDNKYFEMLKAVDKWYSNLMENSLHQYSTWFAVHWFMYTLTAFLSLAYAIEYILMELYSNPFSCHSEHTSHCRLILSYILLFSFHHCILFLYPCFRAASITAARFALIKKVSNAVWPLIPLAEKQAFIQYLKDENCTFKVSIICAKLSFGFELAYFSIFLGIMSVVLKISL